MANIIIKSRERKEAEAHVARIFGGNMRDTAQREYVECVAARTKEAADTLKKKSEERQ